MSKRKQFKVLYDPIEDQVWVRFNRRGSRWREAETVGAALDLCLVLIDKGRAAMRQMAMRRYLGYQEAVMA
jgi:hypothetical protein